MKTFRYITIAALALMTAACTSEDINQSAPATADNAILTLPFSATIGTPAGTRALTAPDDDNNNITAAWAEGDKIAVVRSDLYNGAPIIDVMDVVAPKTDGTATINGTITYKQDNDAVYLVFVGSENNILTFESCLENVLTEGGTATAVTADNVKKALMITMNNLTDEQNLPIYQDGTLEAIDKYFDYRFAQSTLGKNGDFVTLSDSPTLNAQCAIWKLTLSDGTNDITATDLTITQGSDDYNIKPNGTSFYVVLPPAEAKYSFKATTADNDIYVVEKDGINLEAGKFYISTLTMAMQLVDVKDISLDKTSLSFVKDEYYELTATITPDKANKTVVWESDNASVATVDDDGKVTAVGVGMAIITATATNGTLTIDDDLSVTCKVTVTAPEPEPNSGTVDVSYGEETW
jgi:hypothetical protein